MIIDEFIQQVGILGFVVGIDDEEIAVLGKKGSILLSVSRYSMYEVNTQWSDFEKLDNDLKAELLRLGNKLASTPTGLRIEEEEIPKKYYLKLPSTIGRLDISDEICYLNYHKISQTYMFLTHANTESYKTQFTQDEIDVLGLHWLTKEEVE